MAGTSAGAITAAFTAADASPEELKEIVLTLDFRKFEDEGWEDKLPLIDRTASILLDLGIYEGKYFEKWIREELEKRNIRTFKDLVRDPGEEDLRYRYKLHLIRRT